uniref:Uncharacterized protein n=1 Tax=Mycena chlorophos TaxID=658473 RepID=A0ABQ0LMP5_MYCCL|nr:predicted protein [Mycena chlorophos]
MKNHRILLAAIVFSPASVVAYTWPDTAYDVVEEFLWKDHNNFLEVPELCSEDTIGQPSTSAAWLRTVYHDAATADVAAGTGGVDGSIFYETARAENVGDSIASSVSQFASFYGKYISCVAFIFRFNGGVDHADFPTVNPTSGIASFDHTVQFDNNIAVTYFNGTTIDPLIVGPAASDSDARIFASDGNATVQSFAASQDTYFSTCSSLLQRMINTVPGEVKLSDPILAIPFKPRDYLISLLSDGTVNINVIVDIFGPNVISTTRVVTMHWNDRDSDSCASNACSALPVSQESNSGLAKKNGNDLQAYTFSVNATSAASFSSFWFTVDEDGTGKNVVTENNGGGNYPVDDLLLVVPQYTCQGYLNGNLNITGRITVAIRSSVTPSAVTLESTSFGVNGQPIPQIFDGPAAIGTSPVLSPSPDYIYYTGLVPGPIQANGCSTQMEYSATIDGVVHPGQILYSGCTSRASTRLPESTCEYCGFPCTS